jgi:hypothetical protein
MAAVAGEFPIRRAGGNGGFKFCAAGDFLGRRQHGLFGWQMGRRAQRLGQFIGARAKLTRRGRDGSAESPASVAP